MGEPVRVLYGKNGLAWGKGESAEQHGTHKPSGQARPGGRLCHRHDLHLRQGAADGADYPFHTITAATPGSTIRSTRSTTSTSWSIPPFLRHGLKNRRCGSTTRLIAGSSRSGNSDHPVPGAGSAIFFHIQRGPDRPSAGCTVMTQPAIVRLVRCCARGTSRIMSCSRARNTFGSGRHGGCPIPKRRLRCLTDRRTADHLAPPGEVGDQSDPLWFRLRKSASTTIF